MSIIKKNILIIVLLAILLAVSFVAAATSVEFVETEVIFDVDYNYFNEDEETITENGQFSLTNNDDEDITINVYFENLPLDYSIDDQTNLDIPAGETINVDFSIEVPHEADAGTTEIGSIVVKEGSTELDRVNLVQNTLSMLRLNEFTVEYTSSDGDIERDNFDQDDELFELDQNIRPGTEVSLTIELENLFDDDYEEGNLEEIKITLELDANNDFFAEDFEEDYEMDDIDADQEGEITISFLIDEEADADDYTFDILIEAEDDQNARYEIEKELHFTVSRERNDVRIIKAEIEPVTTAEESFSLDLEIKNFGTRNQRYTVVNVFNAELDIDESIGSIRVDLFSDDDEWKHIFNFELEDVSAGSYPLDITVYINSDDKIDFKRVNLVVEEVEEVEEPEEEIVEEPEEVIEEEPVVVEEEEEEETDNLISGQIVSTVESTFDMGNILAITMIAACLVMIAIIVIIFILILR